MNRSQEPFRTKDTILAVGIRRRLAIGSVTVAGLLLLLILQRQRSVCHNQMRLYDSFGQQHSRLAELYAEASASCAEPRWREWYARESYRQRRLQNYMSLTVVAIKLQLGGAWPNPYAFPPLDFEAIIASNAWPPKNTCDCTACLQLRKKINDP